MCMQQIVSFILLEIAHAVIAAACTATYSVILRTKQKLNEILAANTGQPLEQIQLDTERDHYMTPQEAKAYGLIDEVIAHR